MKLNRINKHIFTLLILLSTIACDDEQFLEANPEDFFTTDNIFSSAEQVDQVLITMYSRLRNFDLLNYQIRSFSSDVMDAPEFRFSSTAGDYSRLNSQSDEFSTVYNFYYTLIGTANTAIAAGTSETVSFESEEQRAYILAQARFFRAYAHGLLAQLFGGVPIVTEIATEPRFDYERASRAETYQFAIDELEAVLNDIPETTLQDGRVVRGAVQHYLAEFYLSLGIDTADDSMYDQAISYASDVIDGGTYNLMTSRFGVRQDEADKDVWWDLFRFGNVNYNDGNMESVWTYQIDFDAFLAEDSESRLQYPRYYSPVYRAIEGFDGIGVDAGGRGVAFWAPTPYARDLVWDAATADNDQRNAPHNMWRTIIYNDSINFPDLFGTEVPQSVIDATNEGFGWIYPVMAKLVTDDYIGLDQGENGSNLFRDEYAIRLPETIFIRAEAYHRKGQNQEAADDINMIRSRAQCTVLATAADVDLDYILDERARELYGEESRWNTLLRMGGTVAVDRLRQYAMFDVTRETIFDFNLWPIPQSEIDRNKDVTMAQNPGW